MKTPEGTPAPDLHGWAGQHLQVPAQASVREARAAFLARLAEFQWLPPPAVHESLEYWTRPAGAKIFPSLSEQAFHDEESRLRGQIDEFAQNFFSLQPRPRQARHEALAAQCAWSVNLSARLRALSSGLDLDSRAWEDAPPAQQELAQHLCQLFVLPPAERGRRRWQLLQELQGSRGWQEPSDWRFAAQALRDEYPDLAGLDSGFIDELARNRSRRTPGRGRIPQVVHQQASHPAKQTSRSSGGSAWPIGVVIFIAVAVLRVVFSGVGTQSRPQPQFHNAPPPAPDFRHNQFHQDRIDERLRQRANQQKQGDPQWPIAPKDGKFVPPDPKVPDAPAPGNRGP